MKARVFASAPLIIALAVVGGSARMIAGTATAALVPFATPTTGPVTHYYVSPSGSDSTGDGSRANPWRQLTKAATQVRLVNAGMTNNIVVHAAAGSYSSLSLAHADSGFSGHTIIYQSDGGPGAAMITAGVPVTGWTLDSGNVYKADVSALSNFFTLYENGVRAQKARTPDFAVDTTYPLAQNTYLHIESGSGNTTFVYATGTLDPTTWDDVADGQVYVWSGAGTNWFADTVPIASVNSGTRTIVLADPVRYNVSGGCRFFVQGASKSFIDGPGQFHLNTTTHTLYYWPRATPITSQNIIAPQSTTALSIVGDSESSRASRIIFDGFDMHDGDWTSWYRFSWPNAGDSGACPAQNAYERIMEMAQHQKGLVTLQSTDNITFRNVHIHNGGYSGIFALFYNETLTIQDSLIEGMGHSGIYFEGHCPGDADVNRGNTVYDVKIHDVGQLFGGATGMYIKESGHNVFQYMEIYNAPRSGWYVGTADSFPAADVYAWGSTFDHIYLHNLVQDSGDVGALSTSGLSYPTDVPMLANSYSQILIDQTGATSSMGDRKPDGIYCDFKSAGQTFTNVESRNSQNTNYHELPGGTTGNMVLTNTSFLSDGSANPAFDSSQMDYAHIGVLATFPAFPTCTN